MLALTSVSGLFPTWQLVWRCDGGYWSCLSAGLASLNVFISAVLAWIIPKIATRKQSDLVQWVLAFMAATSAGLATQIIGSKVEEAGQIVAAALALLITVVLGSVIVILQRYENED